MFHETGNRSNFQGRYVVRHPFEGAISCDAEAYRAEVQKRQEREAATLASLTGWNIAEIRSRIPSLASVDLQPAEPWWKKLWN